MSKPVLYLIAGPDGAGKSTLYHDVIAPRVTAPLIDAELIRRDELRRFDPQAVLEAARIAEARRQEHLRHGHSFVIETTLSHPSGLALIDEAKAAGFRVALYHVNVRSAELAVRRVAARAGEGGQDVPEEKVRARYARNGELIHQAAGRSDYVMVYDNSRIGRPPALALALQGGQLLHASERVPAWARAMYALELAAMSTARLNPAAASFEDAKTIVANLDGADAVLMVPMTRKGTTYTGPVVGESALHYIQRFGEGRYAGHFKRAFERPLAINRDYALTYLGRGRALAESVPAVAGLRPDTAAPLALAQKLLGPRAMVSQHVSSGVFRGEIVGETEHHFVQRISARLAALHEKARVPAGLQIGSSGTLRYKGGKASFESARDVEQGRGMTR